MLESLSLTRGTNTPLTYTYNGNQLTTLSGMLTGTQVYDGNGNLEFDYRSDVTSGFLDFDHNILNLVSAVGGGQDIVYDYTAAGEKVAMYDNSTGVTIEYVKGIEYTNGQLTAIVTEEGRAVPNGGTYRYEYTLKDHLGNNRVRFDSNGGALRQIQEDDYYAFGLNVSRYNLGDKDKHLYNGKELQEQFNQYDYGARFYDPVIGRWTSVDPLAEKTKKVSPYIYGANNPIRFIDPDGMEVIASDDQSKKNIKYTLTKEEAKFLSFDKNGKVDTKKLNKYKGSSDNFNALKELANSKTGYHFAVASEYTSGDGKSTTLVGDNDNGTRGVTLLPGAEIDPSPDKDVYIYTSDKLSEERQVKNTAHEGYAHALLYEFKQQGQDVDPNHHFQAVVKTEIDPDTKQPIYNMIRTETNDVLKQQLRKVETQAVENYRKWKEGGDN